MTGWTVLLRGVRHRTGRSLVVLLLAAVAVTAAVLTPAYARAAQQSVLTDTLREAPAYASSVTVKVNGTGDSAAFEPALESSQKADAAIKARPLLHDLVGRPVTTVETEAILPSGELKARYVFRSDLCKLVSVTGDCPTDNDQVIVSDRTAKAHGLEAGDRITLTIGGKTQQREIVGVDTEDGHAVSCSSSAWGGGRRPCVRAACARSGNHDFHNGTTQPYNETTVESQPNDRVVHSDAPRTGRHPHT